MTVKVKICGITNHDDALLAAELGADALGFIFAKSPRRVFSEKAREIIRSLPPFIKSVGVFVDEELPRVKELIEFCGLDLVQLHGNETPSFCRRLIPHSIKAFRVLNELDHDILKKYQGHVRSFLFDTYSKKSAGGTGRTFEWNLALKAKDMDIPIIVAGGLGPKNIAKAIKTIRPYAVDINSGIEISPGKKDHDLMKKTMQIIRETSNQIG